jgi:hypothetical protein
VDDRLIAWRPAFRWIKGKKLIHGRKIQVLGRIAGSSFAMGNRNEAALMLQHAQGCFHLAQGINQGLRREALHD